MKPWRRASIGTYVAVIDGKTVTFQRDGRSGFILRMGKGSLSVRCRRLCDAYALAMTAVEPRIFDVMEDGVAVPPWLATGGGAPSMTFACAA